MKEGICLKVNDKTIESGTVRKIQKSQYYLLENFDRFCKEHDLRYTLDFGTILGAVRHEGFIPWDDDIDVAMLRDEYNKFLSLAGESLNEDIFVQNYHTDPEFIHSFTRLRLNNTLAIQDDWKNLKAHHGIFIDIFVYDVMAEDEISCQRHADEIRTIQEEKMKYVLGDTADESNLKVLNHLQTEVMTRFNKEITKEKYVAHMTQGLESYYPTRRKVSDFEDIILMKFEHDKFPVPANYESILKYNYGDYMEYPSEKYQKPHHGIIRLQFRDDILNKFDK